VLQTIRSNVAADSDLNRHIHAADYAALAITLRPTAWQRIIHWPRYS
jgi:hypothetical protein